MLYKKVSNRICLGYQRPANPEQANHDTKSRYNSSDSALLASKIWPAKFQCFIISFWTLSIYCMSLLNVDNYTASQKHESTLLHTYVLNEFLTANRLCKTKYFRKNSNKS